MNEHLSFNQWLNRFFEQSNFCRDILKPRVRRFLFDEFKAGRTPIAAASNLEGAIWREELP